MSPTARLWLLIPVVAVVLAGCGRGSAFAKDAEDVAQWTQAYGDGYREASEPDFIVTLLKKYSAQKGGNVFASDVSASAPAHGHVDVHFTVEGDGKWDKDTQECWRFSWSQEGDDPYIRDIEPSQIACPAALRPSAVATRSGVGESPP